MKRKIILSVFLIIAVLSTNVVNASRDIKNDLENIVLKQILNNVMNLEQGKIGEILQQFSINNSRYIWTLQEGSLPEYTNAITQLTTEGAVTILDYNKLSYASNLSVARTVIHELVHAHLLLFFAYETSNASKEYPGIPEAWYASSQPDYNAIQHEEMAASFVDDIALALKEYSETLNMFFDDSVYSDLAWGGLDFQNNTALEEADKKRIQLRLVSAQLNISVEDVGKNLKFL
jgi:hypothetical protein